MKTSEIFKLMRESANNYPDKHIGVTDKGKLIIENTLKEVFETAKRKGHVIVGSVRGINPNRHHIGKI